MAPRVRPTINEVARLAEVSTATVSRALSNSPLVRPETRERVLRAANMLEYHVDHVARSLKRRNTQIVAFVVPYAASFVFSNPFTTEVMHGICSALAEERRHLLLSSAPDGSGYDDLLRDRVADGLILYCTDLDDPQVGELIHEGYPFVLIGSYVQSHRIHRVDVDNVAAIRGLVRYLADLGHRRIAYLGIARYYTSSLERPEGYRLGLADCGIPYDPNLVFTAPGPALSQEVGYELMQRALAQRPTAVIGQNDLIAVGAIAAIQDAGLGVPGNISVAGFDDSSQARLLYPGLTSIRQSAFEKGQTAARLLLQVLRGEVAEPREIVLSTELVVRESCGPPPGEG